MTTQSASTPLAPAPAPADAEPGAQPYKFLNYFEESDEPKFAGRDRDISEVVSRISSSRTFVLFGRSGLGKTSLLKAGIFPRLRERGFLPVYVRTLTSPLADLITALTKEAERVGLIPIQPLGEASEGAQARHWADTLSNVYPLVLVLDQFEEFFIRFRDHEHDEARAAFVAAVATMVDDLSLDIRVVFSLREDYLAELDAFGRRLPGLLDKRYRLTTLSAFGAREAIVKPLRHADIPFSQTLVTRLVDMLANVGFDPSMLQIVCTEVYGQAVKRGGDLRLTEDDLTRIGDFDGIFRRYLDAVTRRFEAEDLLVARTVLDAMITREDTKQATTVDSLREARFSATEAEIHEVLRVLDESRLIRRDVRDGNDWYELSHERLVPYVREWLNLDKDFLNFRIARDLVTNSSHGDHWRRRPDTLLNKGQVEGVVDPFRHRLRLSADQTEFVLRSAIWSRSPVVAYWYETFGAEASLEILTDALTDPDDGYRMGAVISLRYIPDSEGLILRSLDIASGLRPGDTANEEGSAQLVTALGSIMSSGSDEIRNRLGQSYAAILKAARQAPPKPPANDHGPKPNDPARSIVTQETLQAHDAGATAAAGTSLGGPRGVATKLRDLILKYVPAPTTNERSFKRVRGAATRLQTSIRERGVAGTVSKFGATLFGNPPELEMLVGMAMDGDRLERFPLWLRFRARREAQRRFLVENAEGFKIQSMAGMKAAVLAAFLWCCTIGFVTSLTYHLFFEPEASARSETSFWSYYWMWLAAAVAAAVLIGWKGARLSAEDVIRKERRFRVARLLGAKSLVFAIWVTILFLCGMYLYTPGLAEVFVFLGLSAWATLVLAAVLEAATSLVERGHRAREWPGLFLWVWFAGSGLVFCAYALTGLAGQFITGHWPETGYTFPVLSYALTVLAVARGAGELRMAAARNELGRADVPSRAARNTCVIACISGVVMLVVVLRDLAPDPIDETTTATPVTVGPATVPVAPPSATPADESSLSPSQIQNVVADAARLSGKYGATPDWPKAFEDLRVAIQKAPRSVELHQARYEAANRAGRLNDAVEEAKKVVELDRNSKIFLNNLARGLCLEGRFDEALPHAREAVQRNRNDAINLDILGHAEFGVGHWVEAADAWTGAEEHRSPYSELPAACVDDQRRLEEAERHIAQSDPSWLTRRAADYVSRQRWAKAIRVYRILLESGEDRADLHAGLATALEATGDLGASVVETRKAVAIDKENPAHSGDLARRLDLIGRPDEALPHARDAVRLAPKDLNALDALAHSAYATNRWAEAADAWSRIESLDPTYIHSKTRAICAEDPGHFEDAKAKAKSSELTIPDNPFADPR